MPKYVSVAGGVRWSPATGIEFARLHSCISNKCGVGFADLYAQGTVCDLRRVSDLDGLYAAADANVAVGSGSGSQSMRRSSILRPSSKVYN